MSGAKPPDTLGPHELAEWLEALGLPVEGGDERALREQLTDGVLLCQLVNKIKPGSVEIVSLCYHEAKRVKSHALRIWTTGLLLLCGSQVVCVYIATTVLVAL